MRRNSAYFSSSIGVKSSLGRAVKLGPFTLRIEHSLAYQYCTSGPRAAAERSHLVDSEGMVSGLFGQQFLGQKGKDPDSGRGFVRITEQSSYLWIHLQGFVHGALALVKNLL